MAPQILESMMEITIGFGWWVLPALVTLISFGMAAYADRDNSPGTYGVGAFCTLIVYSGALIASLIAWLVYALLV